MEYNPDKKEISLGRIPSKLDKFVISFTNILNKSCDYVIVSGYVSILLGRSRATEDVDLLIPALDKAKFFEIWNNLYSADFECLNTSDESEAFKMLEEHAIRFAVKGKPIPNMEFKIIKNDLDKYSFDNKIKVLIDKNMLFLSPIEMQISYKLFLGSDKDMEDAKHLYVLFSEKLNKEELIYFANKLKVIDKLETIKK